MGFEIGHIQRLTGGQPHQVVEAEQTALFMDILAEPTQQRDEIPLAERGIKSVDLTACRRHQLRGRHGPKRVTGEIAEQAVIPVNILQHVKGIVGLGNAY